MVNPIGIFTGPSSANRRFPSGSSRPNSALVAATVGLVVRSGRRALARRRAAAPQADATA
jgi:hypothetical protein